DGAREPAVAVTLAEEAFATGDIGSARQVLARLDASGLRPALAERAHSIGARVALAAGDLERAAAEATAADDLGVRAEVATARLRELSAQLVDFFRAQPPARRLVLATTAVGSLVAVLALAWWVQRPLYRPLFTNLAAEDASAIVEALRAEKAPFRLEDGGRAILVPAERLYELRLALASHGLPAGGGVGFELFDRQTLGQTDFLQRLNYQRALQGELGRTISRLGGVESARVHLALPERSRFVGEDRRPSASVMVKLAPGRALSAAQIY